MQHPVILQLEGIKKTINRAQVLQDTIDNLEGKRLPDLEKKIQTAQSQLTNLEKNLEEFRKKLKDGETDAGCLSTAFVFLGLILGGIIGTAIFPIIGSVLGAIIGFFICALIATIIDTLLNGIFPKREEKQKARGAVEWAKNISELEEKKRETNKELFPLLQDKKQICIQLPHLKKELLSLDKPKGLSLEYCDLAIIDSLIRFLEVGRADTLKEALNLYEDELHKEMMIKLQEEQIRLGQKLTAQQEQALKQQVRQSKQLRYSNVLNTVNTIRHWSK